MHSIPVSLIIATWLILSNGVVYGANLEREKRMALEIVDSILDGEVEMLKDGGHQFLSIYTEAEQAKRVDGADHYFTDRGDEIVEAIGEWLGSLDIR